MDANTLFYNTPGKIFRQFVSLFMCVVGLLLHNLYVNLHLSVVNIIKKCSPTENNLPQPRAYKQTPTLLCIYVTLLLLLCLCVYIHITACGPMSEQHVYVF